MRSARFRHTIEIQPRTEIRDANGGYSETWVTTAYRRASIWPASGREQSNDTLNVGQVTHNINTRYDSVTGSLKPSDRIKYGLRVFEIVSVLNYQEKNKEVRIQCRENV